MNVFTFMSVLPFCLGYVVYAAAVVLAVTQRGAFAWSPVVLTFVILPVLDAIIGLGLLNPAPDDEARLARDPRFRVLTWTWVVTGTALTAYALAAAAAPGFEWSQLLALAIGVGLMNGAIGITYAHELIHQPGRFEQFLGEALLTLVTYGHFRIEHVYGHHRNVATPQDPATARRGESFYRFLPRSVLRGLASAWTLECARLARAGTRTWSWRNRMLWYAAATVGLYALVLAWKGLPGIVFFAVQSAVAVASLEVINYIEHYALLRREIAPGRFETTRPVHSWNASHRGSNWVLINLARHSDHHAAASRRYQLLRTFPAQEVPQLPQGYASMYLLALVPPLWFAIMNPRADRWRVHSDVAANVAPDIAPKIAL